MDSKHLAATHVEQSGGRRRSPVVDAPAPRKNTLATNDDVFRRTSVAVANFDEVVAGAQHNMGVWEAISLYPKAVIFSMILSLSLVMEGYDTALTGNFYGLQQSNSKFGVPVSDAPMASTS
jgi:hypothetical protein